MPRADAITSPRSVMKDLLINGTRFLTTDEIADAALDYSSMLHQFHLVDTIRFPAVVDGMTSRAAVAVGVGAHIVVIDEPGVIPIRLSGAAEAAEIIRHQRENRADPWAGSGAAAG
jgi:hypothetical protein